MMKILNPNHFNKFANYAIPFLSFSVPISFAISLYFCLINSPEDYQQGEMVRVMYVHVPAAWMSLGIFSMLAVCSLINIIRKIRMGYILALAAAPIGAMFALVTLITGSLWGKPIWGTWWVWDARLTSMLILFLLYLCYMAVASSGNNLLRAEKPAAVIAIIGFINVPIVKFSVDIWYSLHQPASIIRLEGPAIHPSMLIPLFLMFFSFILYFLLTILIRAKIIIEKIRAEMK